MASVDSLVRELQYLEMTELNAEHIEYIMKALVKLGDYAL